MTTITIATHILNQSPFVAGFAEAYSHRSPRQAAASTGADRAGDPGGPVEPAQGARRGRRGLPQPAGEQQPEARQPDERWARQDADQAR